jgi:hypothetical protein
MKDLDRTGALPLGAEIGLDDTRIANHSRWLAFGHYLPGIHHYEVAAKSPDYVHQVFNHQKGDAIFGKMLDGALHDLEFGDREPGHQFIEQN